MSFKAKRAEENLKATRDQVKASDVYLNSLDKLMAKEKLSNAERIHAIELLNRLKGTYSDLSIAIDVNTGKVSGDWEETKRQIYEARQKQLIDAQQQSIDASSRTIAAKLARDVEGSGKDFGMGPDWTLIQQLTATNHAWNWHTANSDRLRAMRT